MRRSKTLYCAVCVVLAGVLALMLWRGRVAPSPAPQRAAMLQPAPDASSFLPKFQASHGAQIRIAPSADGFTTVLPPKPLAHSRWQNPAKPVVAHFPRDFSNPVRVQSGSAAVSARPLNARNSTGRIAADGALIYPDAFEHCDVVYRSSEFKTEEFLVVREPAVQSATQWSWQLDTRDLKPRVTPAHTIELCDNAGVPRLRINAPEGKDAANKPLRAGQELTLSISGDVLTLAADLNGCEFPVVIDPTWTSTGTMAIARREHGATLLNNGKVLVAAGAGFSGFLASSEVFDPTTSTWSSVGNLSVARGLVRSALMSNGKVLVAGGDDGVLLPALNSCEVFDPSTSAWTTVANLNVGHRNHTVIRLNDGRIYCTGGVAASQLSAEVFNGTSWTATSDITRSRAGLDSALLPDGRVLLASDDSAEIYDPIIETNTATSPVIVGGAQPRLLTLSNGSVLLSGGRPGGGNSVRTCEIYNPSTGLWAATGNMNTPRYLHGLLRVGPFVMAIGGSGDGQTQSSCELFDLNTNTWTATTSLGTARVNAGSLTLQDGTVLITGGSSDATAYLATCERFKLNDSPTVTAAASPAALVAGSGVAFTSTATDVNGDTLTYLWDFGDGTTSTDSNPAHSYAAAGTYTARVTVTDPSNDTASATVIINVYGATARPIARFTTSDVVAFVGQPFTFDASLSTDKQNGIVSYRWNFGDSSPLGFGQVISKIYETAGTYTVALEVPDNDGLSGTASRQIEVLPAEQFGKFNSSLEYKVKWDRGKDNKDSLTLEAVVSVGADTQVVPGAAVALEIAGVRFEGTLDTKLRDFSNKDEKWQVKAGTRKQQAGEVLIKIMLKKVSLGAGFNQAGAVVGIDPDDLVELDIPIKLEIAGRVFEIDVASEFKFNKDGKKASGEGAN